TVGLRARRSRGWCRCSGGRAPMPTGLRAGTVPGSAGRGPRLRGGTSERQNDGGSCPRPCRRHPSRRHPASQQCGSARWSARSCADMLGVKVVQVNAKLGYEKESSETALPAQRDRKSTRLNSSHGSISYAVFCLKKKNKTNNSANTPDPLTST